MFLIDERLSSKFKDPGPSNLWLHHLHHVTFKVFVLLDFKLMERKKQWDCVGGFVGGKPVCASYYFHLPIICWNSVVGPHEMVRSWENLTLCPGKGGNRFGKVLVSICHDIRLHVFLCPCMKVYLGHITTCGNVGF